jgi:uncharacterized protein (DUF433 family)
MSKRLKFDPFVSVESPVIVGTWITAAYVVQCLCVDRMPLDRFLKTWPETSACDVVAALNYVINNN